MQERGIVYVASRKLRFLCEAIASAETAKRFLPDVPICLATDIEELFGQEIEPFDDIVALDAPPPMGLESWCMGLLTKVRSFASCPYRRGLFLDSDTRVLTAEIAHVFDDLDRFSFALVPCTPENSRSCALYGPMFNTGVVAYRTDETNQRIFARWEELQLLHMGLAGQDPPGATDYVSVPDDDERRYLLVTDQLSFARLVGPEGNDLGIDVKHLDDSWNARDRAEGDLAGVKIDHANRYKVDDDQVEAFLEARGMLGDAG